MTDLGAVVARVAVVPLLQADTLRSEQVSQLVLGETAAIQERRGTWLRLRTDLDGYEGWAHRGYLLATDVATAATWRATAIGWCQGALVQAEAEPPRWLPLRARVGLVDGLVVLPDGARMRLLDGCIRPALEVQAEALACAPQEWARRHFAGAPYLWGGVTPGGVDCSGLVQTTYAARGVILPRDAWRQAEVGTGVEPAALAPGDLLFFSETGGRIDHVAFAAAAEQVVHSTVRSGGVVVESWAAGGAAARLRAWLVAVRRVPTHARAG